MEMEVRMLARDLRKEPDASVRFFHIFIFYINFIFAFVPKVF